MLNNKNVSFKHTLEEYNKKYGNKNLKKISKVEVDKNPSLLNNKHWWFINDTYYQVTNKNGVVGWWLGLGKWAKIGLSVGAVSVLATAIIVPIVVTNNNKEKKEDPLSVVEFTTCSWSDVSKRCNKFENGEITEDEFIKLFTINGDPITKISDFVGKERIAKVNNKDHKVRVIGIKHDKDASDKQLAFTFEFVNFISDSYGYSLNYQWNDTNSMGPNFDYINSTIRYALTGEGNNNGKQGGKILVAQYDAGSGAPASSWSAAPEYNKPILQMISDDLANELKTVKKTVGIANNTENPNYVETSFNDKLFLISGIELGYDNTSGYDKGFGTIYSYYSGHTGETDLIRAKKQVNNSTKIESQGVEMENKGQLYEGPISNYAGLNMLSENLIGAHYWTRSPYYVEPDEGTNKINFCQFDGSIYGLNGPASSTTAPVSPLFCL